MLIREHQLGLADVDLGALDELAILRLFGDAQAHALAPCHRDPRATIRDIVDVAGNRLYPAYYRTHLLVPRDRPLHGWQLWDRVAIGVEVQSFGGMLLESRYSFDSAGASVLAGPRMEASSMFVLDGPERTLAAPAAGSVAELERLRKPPEAMVRYRAMQSFDPRGEPADTELRSATPLLRTIVAGRDVAPHHQVMFATWTRLLFEVEQHVWISARAQPWPESVYLLERELLYFGSCGAGAEIRMTASGAVTHDDEGRVIRFEGWSWSEAQGLLVHSRSRFAWP